MALDDLELSLMAFPQRWVPAGAGAGDGTLQLNVLLLPVGDPTQPLGGGPPFAGTSVPVVANLSGPAALPNTDTTTPVLTRQLVLAPPPVAPILFAQLAQQFATAGITVTSGKLTTAPGARIRKSLPASYTKAIPFEGPASSDVEVGDGYGCTLLAQAPGLNQQSPGAGMDKTIAWGQVLSYALRQPELARRLGLIYPFSITVPDATLATGGFVYVTLDAGSPWTANQQASPDSVRSYAARLPALAASGRPLFAAALLPVVALASQGSNLTQAQLQAAEYDDGFAQVVHCNQPATIDAAALQPGRIAPGSDAGLQVGWDDEQVTAWLNGQLDLLRVRVDPACYDPQDTPEAPLGVQGYRVDVRVAGKQKWASLCAVKGALPFNDTSYGSPAATAVDGELWVAPAPVRPSKGPAPANDSNDEAAWLPLYFAQWAGVSLVLPDPVVRQLAASTGPNPPTPTPALRPDLSGVPPLRYGADYEFRVRLADLTGGGPDESAAPVHPGPVPVTLAKFRRHVTPKALLVDTHENLPPYPAVPPAFRHIETLTVRRPRIGYPEALFAGVAPAMFASANLAALINEATANGGVLDIPDPDVGSFDVIVETRAPAHDTGTPGTDAGDLDGNFRVVYSVSVPFGAGADPSVTLTLDYTDGIDDISRVTPPAHGATTLPIPTARDIRVRLQPRCVDKPEYYGVSAPLVGPYSDYIVRQAAATEDSLFSGSAATQLSALYFQPGSNIPQLLAQQLGVAQNGLTLTGQPGQRTVFGASGALRHTVTADGGSITFSNQTELLGHWIVAITVQVERDWTWDGFAQPATAAPSAPSLSFGRDGNRIGVITVSRTLAASTFADPTVQADRSGTRIVFFDAINPNPAPGAFPAELSADYTVTASFETAPAKTLLLQVALPITTPPAQTPRIVATGLAESPYAAASDYSSTSSRDRFLWMEFEEPINDPEDCYFGRVLAYGPDPLLALELAPIQDPGGLPENSPEPALPVDPEPVRVIFPGQASDESGISAMTPLIPAVANSSGTQGTFFMLPLPPGITAEDPQLFGFWTYEFRVGRAKRWSTAQGRFGRPLRVSGIQHPPPNLICSVNRTEQGVAVSAPYATAMLNGRRVFSPAHDPQTEIWFMLYAQAMQVDDASRRNILLGHAAGIPLGQDTSAAGAPSAAGPRAYREFPQEEVIAWLNLIGLPQTSSLSVLAVELLPFGQVQTLTDTSPATAPAGTADAVAPGADPLGANFGSRRILRTSPLTALPSIC